MTAKQMWPLWSGTPLLRGWAVMSRIEMAGKFKAHGVSGRVRPSLWWWFSAPASWWWQSGSRGAGWFWNDRDWTEDDEDDEDDDGTLVTREEERNLWKRILRFQSERTSERAFRIRWVQAPCEGPNAQVKSFDFRVLEGRER